MVRYLTVKEVIFLNHLVITRYTPTEESRIYSNDLLLSAIERPKSSAFQQDAYDTIWLKAGALFESLAKNHAFVGGNKRTAFASLYQFLRLNGIQFNADKKEAEDFTVNMVTSKNPPIHVNEIAQWIENNSIERV